MRWKPPQLCLEEDEVAEEGAWEEEGEPEEEEVAEVDKEETLLSRQGISIVKFTT